MSLIHVDVHLFTHSHPHPYLVLLCCTCRTYSLVLPHHHCYLSSHKGKFSLHPLFPHYWVQNNFQNIACLVFLAVLQAIKCMNTISTQVCFSRLERTVLGMNMFWNLTAFLGACWMVRLNFILLKNKKSYLTGTVDFLKTVSPMPNFELQKVAKIEIASLVLKLLATGSYIELCISLYM